MTDEYIRKADVVEVINKDADNLEQNGAIPYAQGARAMAIVVDQMRPADVVPVRHGTWLPIVSYNNTYKCSECGRLLVDVTDGLKMVAKNYPYCHCGAKMDA